MTDITNPHDRFFKEVFSRPEVAEDFLMHFLPPHVSGLLQPNTFRLQKDSFVDANLSEYFSDLLYQVDFREGQPGFVYILFEHKSYPDPDVAFQLLRYMMRIWEYASKQAVRSLQPIIPMVLYHGVSQWRVPLNLASLYRAPESLKEILCDFSYFLCDLSARSEGEIKLGAMANLALLLFKNIYSENLKDRLTDIFGLLRAMNEQTALEFLETILRYLGAATERVTAEDCRKAIEATRADTGGMHMDRLIDELVAEYGQKFINKGITEGIEEGREEGRKEGIKEGMREGIKEGIKEGAASLTIRLLIRKFGELDSALEGRIRSLSFQELERLGEDLLDFQNESALAQWLDRLGKSH